LFLSAGASISISRFGRTPLHDLAGEFKADDFDDGAIQLLQDAGVDINAIDNEGRTMLDIATRPDKRSKGSEETIQRLKALGARANEAHER
jgi:ankyrin repeat protein